MANMTGYYASSKCLASSMTSFLKLFYKVFFHEQHILYAYIFSRWNTALVTLISFTAQIVILLSWANCISIHTVSLIHFEFLVG